MTSAAPTRSAAPGSDVAGPPPLQPARRGHLHGVDLFRVVTFCGVVAVHSLTFTAPSNVGVNRLLLLLHYTREGFFFLMALVLFHVYYRKQVRALDFWRKRYSLIVVPYVIWTAVYVVVDALNGHWGLGTTLADYGTELWQGHFQLYFLVVSMQLYFVLPALLRFIRRTERWHGAVLAASFALEIATVALLHLHDAHPPAGVPGALVRSALRLLPTYQFYVVAGAIAAVHLEALNDWVRRHTWAVVGVVVGAALVAELWMQHSLDNGTGLAQAVDVFQPVMVLWNAAWGLGLWRLGLWWADRRRAGSLADRVVAEGSDASFGIYLVHALMLFTVVPAIPGITDGPEPLRSIGTLVLALALSALFASAALRTPLARQLTGRARKRGLP